MYHNPQFSEAAYTRDQDASHRVNRGSRSLWRALFFPIFMIERLFNWIVGCVLQLGIFRFLEYLGKATVLAAAIVWLIDYPERKADRAVSEVARKRAEEVTLYREVGLNAGPFRAETLETLRKARAQLFGADLSKSYLPDVHLAGAKLSHANFRHSYLPRARLEGGNFSQANFSNADLQGTNLANADCGKALFAGANLAQATLSRANLAGAHLSGANLQQGNLQGAFLNEANLSGAFVGGANIDGATLVQANLEGAHLNGASLKKAELQGCKLIRTDLTGANLRGAFLRGAEFQGAQLSGAQLRGAELDGTDFRGCNLDGAIVGAPNWFDDLKEMNPPPLGVSADDYSIVQETGPDGKKAFVLRKTGRAEPVESAPAENATSQESENPSDVADSDSR